MSETSPVVTPALEHTLERVLSGIERLEARLDALEAQLPPLAATAADTLDAWAERLASQGILLPERLAQLEKLALTAADPVQLAALTQLLSQLHALTPYVGMLDQVPGLLATAADSGDELARRWQETGAPLPERLHALQDLAGSLTEPARLASLKQLVLLLDQLQPYLGLLPQLPGLAAMTADSLDETYERVLRARPELHQLRQSLTRLATPQTVLMLAALGEALAQTPPPPDITIGQLARSLWDPAVRRTLGFGLRFARQLGHLFPKIAQEVKKRG